jgi:hypothetical protein
MSTDYPNSIETRTNPNTTDFISVDHAQQHDNANDDIKAIKIKVGVDSSTDTNSLDNLVKSTSSTSPGHKHIKSESGLANVDNTSDTTKLAATLTAVYPVGSIYISVVSTNPASVFGFGTWVAFGAGKTLVGLNSTDADFDTAEETGGEKTHQLSTAELAAHGHTQDAHSHGIGAAYRTGASSDWWTVNSSDPYIKDGMGEKDTSNATATNQNTGSNTAHNNLQPYIVVYMFKRTA